MDARFSEQVDAARRLDQLRHPVAGGEQRVHPFDRRDPGLGRQVARPFGDRVDAPGDVGD